MNASFVAYVCAWAVFLTGELASPPTELSPAGLADWVLSADVDEYICLAFLLLAPIAWRVRRPATARRVTGVAEWWKAFATWAGTAPRGPIWRAWAMSLGISSISLAASWWVGRHFDSLPPAYHDEYSYLFQAQTFLAGRLSYPSHAAARLFDQMHVLNEGRYASRYFPGAGAWLAPFVAMGNPWWGQWLAGAVTAMLIFWCGRELAGDFCGLLAGSLTALSPGMALFSNLLLAHHPTLVGLSLFLLAYLRAIRQGSVAWGLAAGFGLCFAALCRPLTAAGIALPFGAYLAWSALTERMGRQGELIPSRRNLPRVLLSMGIPLLAGAALMFGYDRAITGSGWKTPYSAYTEVYTPRHVYGFNNVVRGEQHAGPRVLENYDRWAENLTPRLAVENVERRFVASWKWTLGLIPLTLALVFGLLRWRTLNSGTKLVLAGIVSLHALHVPYWFSGIQHYHYVFESIPLWLLWLAAVTVEAIGTWRTAERWWMPAWWLGLAAATATMNYTFAAGRWSAPLADGIVEVRFARGKHGRFETLVEQFVRPRPALVLVRHDPADRHIDYVVNSPALEDDVLIGRYIPDVVPLEQVRRSFPRRTLYLYDAKDDRLEKLIGQ